MKNKYQGIARAKKQQLQTLRTKFEFLRMNMGESVTSILHKQ
jgi:hypothetical protein